MLDKQEFLNDVMFALERTGTIDGYYFSSRLAGMELIEDPNFTSAVAATDCEGTIIVNLEELTEHFPDKESQALVMAHEVRHNDGMHGDRLEKLIEENPQWGDKKDYIESLRMTANIITDLVINEGLFHTFPRAKSFAENLEKMGGITWESVAKINPKMFKAIVDVGYNQNNVWKMDAFSIIQDIFDPDMDPLSKMPEDVLTKEEVEQSREKGELINSGIGMDVDSAKRAAIQQANNRAQEKGFKGMGPAGCTPGHLVGEFEELGKPKVNFKSLLRNCMNAQSKDRPSYRNKRWASKQGVWNPRLGGKKLGTVAFLIDTSGSVSDEILKEMMGEANNALHGLNYQRCVVIQFSNQIEDVQVYDQRSRINGLDRKVYGRGGTEISLAINKLNEYRDLAATVIMTDGGLYDIKRVSSSDERQFRRAPAFWFVPEQCKSSSRPLESYLERNGHGTMLLYDDTGLRKEMPNRTIPSMEASEPQTTQRRR